MGNYFLKCPKTLPTEEITTYPVGSARTSPSFVLHSYILVSNVSVAAGAYFSGSAKYIVSGDKNLSELKRYKTVKLITPEEFLRRFH
jgi:hypothetical protein